MRELDLDPVTIEAIAQRVVELLRAGRDGDKLVDAATLSRALGVTRATIYAHADELGAVRLGAPTQRKPGQRGRGGARLRFDLKQAVERWCERTADSAPPEPRAARPRRRRGSDSELLPIRGARDG